MAITTDPPVSPAQRGHRRNRSEFMLELFALLGIFVLVHAFYTAVVRPQASVLLAEQATAMAGDPNYVPERSFWIIAKDPEQEVCFVLGFWAIFVMLHRGLKVTRARRFLEQDFLHLPDGMRVLPEDSREYLRQVEALPPADREQLLPRTLHTALER
ncbi:hypothetical protein, partial [Nostoc favosum]